MKKIRFSIFTVILLFLFICFCGCSTPYTTNTKRSAIQQYLLSTTIQRMVNCSDLKKYSGKKVYFDYKYLKVQEDLHYLQGSLQLYLKKNKCYIVYKPQEADIKIEVMCGVLGTDYNTIFIGLPSLPVPVPDTNLNIVIPQIPIFKLYNRKSYGRMTINVTDIKNNSHLEFNVINASSFYKNWVIFLIPFSTMNFNMSDTKYSDTNINFVH